MKKHQSIEEKLWEAEIDQYIEKKATNIALLIVTMISVSIVGGMIWGIVKLLG